MIGTLFAGFRLWIGAVVLAGVFACLLAGSAMAGSTVIYDNGLPADDLETFGPDWEVCNCWYSPFSFFSPPNGVQYQAADDFVLDAGRWAVTGAAWSGGVSDFLPPDRTEVSLPSFGFETTFDILFYETFGPLPTGFAPRPTGTPVDPIPGTAIAHRQVAVVGEPVFPGSDVVFVTDLTRYAADFEPVLLDGGTTYWISIVSRSDYTYDRVAQSGTGWLWSGRAGTGNSVEGGPHLASWGTFGDQVVFALTGNAVPEPHALALLALGMMGLAYKRSR